MNPTLAKAAANLKRRAYTRVNTPPLPSVWLMSDETRLPDPAAVLSALPRGAAVILRHYSAPHRVVLAKTLAGLCRRHRLHLVIAGDWRLAARVDAQGLHLAEHAMYRGPGAGARLWLRQKKRILTAAAHGAGGLRRAQHANAAAVLLSPVFTTASHPDRAPLAPARLAVLVRDAKIPVIALGGITAANIARLRHSGCAGIAGIGFALD